MDRKCVVLSRSSFEFPISPHSASEGNEDLDVFVCVK